MGSILTSCMRILYGLLPALVWNKVLLNLTKHYLIYNSEMQKEKKSQLCTHWLQNHSFLRLQICTFLHLVLIDLLSSVNLIIS